MCIPYLLHLKSIIAPELLNVVPSLLKVYVWDYNLYYPPCASWYSILSNLRYISLLGVNDKIL